MSTNEADAIVHALLHTPEGRANPYPMYHRLREIAPVHRTAGGLCFLTRYDDCAAALRDPRLGKDYPRQMEHAVGPDWRSHVSLTTREHSMLNLNGAAAKWLERQT